MPDLLALWLMGLVVIGLGTDLVVAGLSGLAHLQSTAWYEPLPALIGGTTIALTGILLARVTGDYRVLIVGPGHATLTWTIARLITVRVVNIDVQRVVVQHDIWRMSVGSTDRVILEGQGRVHVVVEVVSNAPPTGSFKVYNSWRVGPASQLVPRNGNGSGRTVSPLILGLAKALAEAARVSIVLRLGTARGPLVAIGGD
jgi:hypothetical protein